MADYVQLVDGLLYLVVNNFHHTSLDCSSVLVNLNGRIKIGKFIPFLPSQSISSNQAR
jgi:hypothetical protein